MFQDQAYNCGTTGAVSQTHLWRGEMKYKPLHDPADTGNVTQRK